MVEFLKDDECMTSMVHAYRASINGTQFKFGMEIPWNTKHALKLNKTNSNSLWKDAVTTELKGINQYQTFCCLKKGEMLGPDFSCIPYFIVFHCKFDGHWKAHLVTNGSCMLLDHMEAYAGVVGMKMVCLGFLLADMNGLQVCAVDISSAYLSVCKDPS